MDTLTLNNGVEMPLEGLGVFQVTDEEECAHSVEAAIGAPYDKTPAQVILRWLRQEGVIAIPKSVHEECIRQNIDVDDFALSPADMAQIAAMDEKRPLILNVPDVREVYRLHGITFEQ